MKSRFYLILLFIVLIFTGGFFLLTKNRDTKTLVNPSLDHPSTSVSLSPSSSPSPTVEEFHFDATTDLKQTLNTVDPKVEDKKIDDLKQIIKSL